VILAGRGNSPLEGHGIVLCDAAGALMVASREGYISIVKSLVSAGADMNLRNKRRETALGIAVTSGQVHLAELLKQ
jgi:ankyrin repeat protein